jgi:cytochrome P450
VTFTPPPRLRLPSPLQTFALARDPLRFLVAAQQRHGDCFLAHIWPVGELLFVADPSQAERFLLDDQRYHAGMATRVVLPILGTHSLPTLDGDAHRQRRQRLLPLFSARALDEQAEWLAALAAAELAQWRDGPLRALPRTRRLAFRVACRLVLGIEDTSTVVALEQTMRRLVGGPAALASWSSSRIVSAPYVQRRAALDRHLLDVIETRPKPTRDTALDLLLDDPSLREPSALLEELRALLIVGHETSACAMAWALERLAWHPDVADRLRAALDNGDERYLDAVVRESLRTRPPVIDAVRTATEDTEICGHEVPAGTILVAALLLIHRRPDMYPDPDGFFPERFLERSPPPASYIPFGAGKRRCLGAPLATREVATLIREAVEHTVIRPQRKRPEPGRLLGTAVAPARGAELIIKRRARLPTS